MPLKLSNWEKSLIFSVLPEMIISSIIWVPMPDIRYIEKQLSFRPIFRPAVQEILHHEVIDFDFETRPRVPRCRKH